MAPSDEPTGPADDLAEFDDYDLPSYDDLGKLLDASAYDNGYAVLTLSGRLLADRLVRDLIAEED